MFRGTDMAPSIGYVFLLLIVTEYVLGDDGDDSKDDVGALVDASNICFAVVGDETRLECRSDSYREHVSTIWYGNDGDTWSDEGIKVGISVFSFFNLTNVTFEDAGSYKCEIYYAEGHSDVRNFKLHVQANPHIAEQNRTTVEGANITAECCVEVSSNVVELEMSWTIESREIRRSDPTVRLYGNTTNYCDQIVFPSHRSYHTQTMRCLILNSLHLSDTTILGVLYSPSTQAHFSDSLNNQLPAFEEYSEVLFVCSAEGNPIPNITLGRIDTGIELPNVRTIFLSDSAVRAEYTSINVTRDKAGTYSCNASNEIDVDTTTAYLNITFAAEIQVLTASPLQVSSNGTFEIECRTTSNPRPEVNLQKLVNKKWESLSTESSNVNTNEHEYIWTFKYTDTQHDYQGLYRCHALNGVGKPVSSESVEVTIAAIDNIIVYAVGGGVILLIVVLILMVAVLCYNRGNSSSFEIARESDNRPGQTFQHYANDAYPDVVSSGLDRPEASNNVTECRTPERDVDTGTMAERSSSSTFSSLEEEPVYAQCNSTNPYLSGSTFSARSSDYQTTPRAGNRVQFDCAGYTLLNNEDPFIDASDFVEMEEVCEASCQTSCAPVQLTQADNKYTDRLYSN